MLALQPRASIPSDGAAFGRVVIYEQREMGPHQDSVTYRAQLRGPDGKILHRKGSSQGDLYCFECPKDNHVELFFWSAEHRPARESARIHKKFPTRIPRDAWLYLRNRVAQNPDGADNHFEVRDLREEGSLVSDTSEMSVHVWHVESLAAALKGSQNEQALSKLREYQSSTHYTDLVKEHHAQRWLPSFRSALGALGSPSDRHLGNESRISEIFRDTENFAEIDQSVRRQAVEAWSKLPSEAPATTVRFLRRLSEDPADPLSRAALVALARRVPAEVVPQIRRVLNEKPERESDTRLLVNAMIAAWRAPLPAELKMVRHIAEQATESEWPMDAIRIARVLVGLEVPQDEASAMRTVWTRDVFFDGQAMPNVEYQTKSGDNRRQNWESIVDDRLRGRSVRCLRIDYPAGNPKEGFLQFYAVPDQGPSLAGATELVITMRSVPSGDPIGIGFRGATKPLYRQPNTKKPVTDQYDEFIIPIDPEEDAEHLGNLKVLAQLNFTGSEERTFFIARISYRRRVLEAKGGR